jgi:hypothetical protein
VCKIKTTSKCCFYLEQRSFVNKQASVSEAWRIYKTSDRSEVSKRKKARAYEARRASNSARFLRFKRTILTGLRSNSEGLFLCLFFLEEMT